MLVSTLVLIGAVLLAMALAEPAVRRLPLSPALVYLCAGWLAATLATPPLPLLDLSRHAGVLRVLSEVAVLVSLFAIGLKVRLPATWRAWRVPVLLATSSMLWSVALAWAVAWLLLPIDPALALLLAAILAPTDPVLASEVQLRDEHDRDRLRLSLSTEGALNDGTAFPLVMLALGLLGLHELGTGGRDWVLEDLIWSPLAGIVLGVTCGRTVGWAMLRRLRERADAEWDELLYLGTIALTYGLALSLDASAFFAVFCAGATLLRQHPAAGTEPEARLLGRQLHAFGARCERLVEVLMVLVIGAAMTRVWWSAEVVAFALAMVLIVRPLAVVLGVPAASMPPAQRRLTAWFGIRGVGSLFYLFMALQAGVEGGPARMLASACLVSLAMSITLHGVSATPLMTRYQGRRAPPGD